MSAASVVLRRSCRALSALAVSLLCLFVSGFVSSRCQSALSVRWRALSALAVSLPYLSYVWAPWIHVNVRLDSECTMIASWGTLTNVTLGSREVYVCVLGGGGVGVYWFNFHFIYTRRHALTVVYINSFVVSMRCYMYIVILYRAHFCQLL